MLSFNSSLIAHSLLLLLLIGFSILAIVLLLWMSTPPYYGLLPPAPISACGVLTFCEEMT